MLIFAAYLLLKTKKRALKGVHRGPMFVHNMVDWTLVYERSESDSNGRLAFESEFGLQISPNPQSQCWDAC
jgi:hypothetical protein